LRATETFTESQQESLIQKNSKSNRLQQMELKKKSKARLRFGLSGRFFLKIVITSNIVQTVTIDPVRA
jgi:hypothetical protein